MAMILWGTLDAASDQTMATVTRRVGSEFRQAVSELISDVAAGIIANDPTIIEAAEQAVAQALEDADVIVGSDYRVPAIENIENTSAVGLDENRVANELDLDGSGAFKPWILDEWKRRGAFMDGLAADIPGTSMVGLDPNGVPSEIDLDETGAFKPWVLAAWAERGLGGGGGASGSGYEVYVGFGQSNMAVSTLRNVPSGVFDEDPGILVWDGSALLTMPANYSSPLAGLARERRMRNGGRRVIIVNGAVGATGFSTTSLDPPPEGYSTVEGGTWDRHLTADPVNLATRLNSRVKSLLSTVPTAELRGLVFSGSEIDRFLLNFDAMSSAIDDIISWYRTEWGVATLPVVVSAMNPTWESIGGGVYNQAVNDALENLPARIVRSAFFRGPWNASHANDEIHFSPTSIPERGRLFADGLDRARTNVSGWRVSAPRSVKGERTGNSVEFRWEQPPGPVAAGFEVATSTDGGSWAPVSLRHPTQTAVTVTSAARVRLRVRTLDPTSGSNHSTYTISEA